MHEWSYLQKECFAGSTRWFQTRICVLSSRASRASCGFGWFDSGWMMRINEGGKKESKREKEMVSIDLHEYFIILHTQTTYFTFPLHCIQLCNKRLPKNPEPSLLLLSDSKLSQFDIILIWKSFSLTVSNTPFFQGVMALIVRVCVCGYL